MRPLAPRTRAIYDRLLIRAYGTALPPFQKGAGLKDWPASCRQLLRAAVLRAYRDAGFPEEEAQKLARTIQLDYRPTLVPKIPTESESKRYEEVARALPEPGHAALALIPLALGLRAEEVVTLKRADVEHAQSEGVLRVMRKGGEEQLLPAKAYKELFAALLQAPAAPPKAWLDAGPHRKKWQVAGDIISVGNTHAKYVALWRLVKRTAKEAGISARPHVLRHLFATRMILDGAPLPTVQVMLNHKQLATTARYLHMTPAAGEKYLRPIGS